MIWIVVAFILVGNNVSTLRWETAHHLGAFEFETHEQCELYAEALRRNIRIIETMCLLRPAKI